MADLPPCRSLGSHCLALSVVLHVADLEDDTPAERDALATWLTGHTERLTFGRPFLEGGALLVDAVIQVPCKYLADGDGPGRTDEPSRRCAAHGFTGPLPDVPLLNSNGTFRHPGRDRFMVVHGGRRRVVELAPKPLPLRSLPVIATDNPCLGAPCRTADNMQGAACCRDLTIDVVLEGGQPGLLELLRSRRSPYLCKVTPDGNGVAECEVISACGYLESDGATGGLHARARPDGRPAKPFVCSQWPELGPGHMGHPGCRLV